MIAAGSLVGRSVAIRPFRGDRYWLAVSAEPLLDAPESFLVLRGRFDDALYAFLAARRLEADRAHPRATVLIDEILRLLHAGGKRLRPAFCYWGYRAAGGSDEERIVRAAAALELLHTFALIHDDLMDGANERRGAPASVVALAEIGRGRGLADPEGFGVAAAILAGDLAAVLADQLFLEASFPPQAVVRALERYHEMRTEMATGQVLHLQRAASDEREARRVAFMKGGGYTVERPLLIGAALAGGPMRVQERLSHFGAPLGEAFQLRDDLLDGDGPPSITKETVNALVAEARGALDPSLLDADAVRALGTLAEPVSIA